ncbi:MAG TPA: response regulator [Planctomycetota bacterium]|nr:response regulator [Planctomycetota bacterium]
MARIMIVEDEADLGELYRIVLGEFGHEVHGPYADPREPLWHMQDLRDAGQIDLILLDERLGRLSGSAYIERFRSAFPGAKIVLVSADPEAVAHGQERGADSALKKPVPIARLLELIASLLMEASNGC